MDDKEIWYCTGYRQALQTVKDMLDGGMSIGMIKEAVEEELSEED